MDTVGQGGQPIGVCWRASGWQGEGRSTAAARAPPSPPADSLGPPHPSPPEKRAICRARATSFSWASTTLAVRATSAMSRPAGGRGREKGRRWAASVGRGWTVGIQVQCCTTAAAVKMQQ